jgi:hypothetical protein
MSYLCYLCLLAYSGLQHLLLLYVLYVLLKRRGTRTPPKNRESIQVVTKGKQFRPLHTTHTFKKCLTRPCAKNNKFNNRNRR